MLGQIPLFPRGPATWTQARVWLEALKISLSETLSTCSCLSFRWHGTSASRTQIHRGPRCLSSSSLRGQGESECRRGLARAPLPTNPSQRVTASLCAPGVSRDASFALQQPGKTETWKGKQIPAHLEIKLLARPAHYRLRNRSPNVTPCS